MLHVRVICPVELREQGFVGPAMLPVQELEYSAFRTSLAELESEFRLRE